MKSFHRNLSNLFIHSTWGDMKSFSVSLSLSFPIRLPHIGIAVFFSKLCQIIVFVFSFLLLRNCANLHTCSRMSFGFLFCGNELTLFTRIILLYCGLATSENYLPLFFLFPVACEKPWCKWKPISWINNSFCLPHSQSSHIFHSQA